MVPNTSRFRIGDEIYYLSTSAGFSETSTVKEIPDDKTIIVTSGSVRGWTVAEGTYIQKAVNFQFIKRIHIGDLKPIPSFPTICLEPLTENNEWMTLRSTSHEYRIAIRTYVLADNFEKTNTYLIKLTEQIREILLDHIRPIVVGESFPLTADLVAGGTVVSIANTSKFADDLSQPDGVSFGYLRDAMPRPSQQESYIKSVLSPTQLELRGASAFNYLVSRQAEIIRAERLLYDTRPESISYGYVPGQGGALMRASEITWFAKEMLCREGNFLT